MTQNRINGGKRTAEKLLALDPDHYRNMGRKGGNAPKTKPNGWAYMKEHDPERLRELGRKGGKKSRRGSSK